MCHCSRSSGCKASSQARPGQAPREELLHIFNLPPPCTWAMLTPAVWLQRQRLRQPSLQPGQATREGQLCRSLQSLLTPPPSWTPTRLCPGKPASVKQNHVRGCALSMTHRVLSKAKGVSRAQSSQLEPVSSCWAAHPVVLLWSCLGCMRLCVGSKALLHQLMSPGSTLQCRAVKALAVAACVWLTHKTANEWCAILCTQHGLQGRQGAGGGGLHAPEAARLPGGSCG